MCLSSFRFHSPVISFHCSLLSVSFPFSCDCISFFASTLVLISFTSLAISFNNRFIFCLSLWLTTKTVGGGGYRNVHLNRLGKYVSIYVVVTTSPHPLVVLWCGSPEQKWNTDYESVNPPRTQPQARLTRLAYACSRECGYRCNDIFSRFTGNLRKTMEDVSMCILTYPHNAVYCW